MKKIGLIAGEGTLPIDFVRSAKKRGEIVVVFAINGMASPLLEEEADKVYWLDVRQYTKFAFLLTKERLRRLAMLGKVKKSVIYQDGYDKEASEGLKKLRNKKDYTILREITDRLGRFGIEVINTSDYLNELLPEKGVIGKTAPGEEQIQDIEFGYDIAKRLAGMDIGQTVIIKDMTVVAVEAIEGTDAAIIRGREVAGEGCVMVKVSRPDQDMRWDIPVVGIGTIEKLAENGYKALAIETGKMYLLDRDKFLETADSAGIAVKIL